MNDLLTNLYFSSQNFVQMMEETKDDANELEKRVSAPSSEEEKTSDEEEGEGEDDDKKYHRPRDESPNSKRV